MNLDEARTAWESAKFHFDMVLGFQFPGLNEWDWYRACSHMRGEPTRRNDDTSHDEALASNVYIRTAFDDYITKLHSFYLLRDGPNGVLGGRRL